MVSAWVEHIREFAKRKGLTYGCALSDPDCKAEYHAKRPPKLNKKEKKEVSFMEAEDINVAEKKKTRGRPKKYSTDEERKKAKTVKTVESNKRKRQEKKGMTGTGAGASTNNQLTSQIVDFLIEKHTQEETDEFRTAILKELKKHNVTIPTFIGKFKRENSPEYFEKLLDFLGLPKTEKTERETMSKEDKKEHKTNSVRPPARQGGHRRADILGRGIKGSPPLTKTQVNKLIKFITTYVDTKKPDPKFKKYLEEDIGEDNIVSRFADTILEAEIPKITEEDKNDLIPDLYDYVKHCFPDYKDTDLNLDKLHKMRSKGNGLKGGKIPLAIKSKIKKIKTVPTLPEPMTHNNFVVDIPPPPPTPPPPNTPTAPRQGTNRRRINGGKLKPPPENPLTQAQGRAILDEIQTNAGVLLPISQARHFQLRQLIEGIGGMNPIEDMRDRFEFFMIHFLHPAQHKQVMRHYDKILAYTPPQGGGLLEDLKKRELTGHQPDMTDLIKFKDLVKEVKKGKLPSDFSIPDLKLILKHNKRHINANWIRNAKQTLDAMEDSDEEKGGSGGALKRGREGGGTPPRNPPPPIYGTPPRTPPKKRIPPLTYEQGNQIRHFLDQTPPNPTANRAMLFDQLLTGLNIGSSYMDLRERFSIWFSTHTVGNPNRVLINLLRRLDRLIGLIQDHLSMTDMDTDSSGGGLIAGYSTEAPNGLSHIYPLSHAHILKMCKHLV